MKKMLLLLIAVATGATIFAQSTTSPVTVQSGKLDGKTYNITLVAKNGDDTKNALVKPAGDVAQNQNSTMNTKGTMNTTTTTTTTTSNAGSTSKTEVMDKTDAMTGNVDEMVKDEKTAEAQSVAPQPAVPQDNTTVSTADYSLFTQPLASTKTTITFNNSMLESPMLTERKLESCPYKITASEADMTLFTATCRSVSPPASAIWSGMVTGKSIKGSVSYKLGNGEQIDYTFTGTLVATKKASSKTKASTNGSSSNDDAASR